MKRRVAGAWAAWCCVALWATCSVHAEDVLTVRSPVELQVNQRNEQDRANVTIAGMIEGPADLIEARADLGSGTTHGNSVDWIAIAQGTEIVKGQFTGKMSLKAGGWYSVSIRARRGKAVIAESKIAKVGVGDVFITAGQSNSANYGKPRQTAKEDRVVYYNGKSFVPARDPIPGGCGGGGSVWPILGDQIVASQQVPVCFRSASLTWTEVKNWMPPETRLYKNLAKCVGGFEKGGIRAVLWHQGESDSLAKTSAETYCSRLKTIIESLNKEAGYDIPWFVAQASFHPGSKQAEEKEVAKGQQLLWEKGIAHKGPVTDDLLGKEYRSDGVHFNQLGLTTHAERWFAALSAEYQFAGITMAADSVSVQEKIDWPAFMQQHDMTFDKLPRSWREAPHFGNASIGSMLYQAGDTIRLQVFRADVQDHRDDTYGWPAYSRAHFQIGHFLLHPVGKLTGVNWRKDLWNAELTGTIQTDKGEIQIRHFTHADDMAIVTELTPSAGEQGCRWTWHPVEARSSRGGYPTDVSQIEAFAKKYGSHYAKTLKVFKANPAGRQETRESVSVWIQDLLAGGQYATAWSERVQKETRTHVVSIANSYPKSTAAETAVADVKRVLKLDRADWTKAHRDWWHIYYVRSFIAIPDKSLESLYWQTIYRFGCTSRTGRYYIDCPGIWFQGGPWAYTTTNWNIQAAHWAPPAANRLEQSQEILDRLHDNSEALINAVRPVEWQNDSAYLPHEVAGDMIGNREQDMRYYAEVGNLPWILNNAWSQYRFSMDDEMLREKVFPLLRRSINLYLHMVEEGDDGKLHLPPTYSPETGVWKDANFDLALFKWGCYTLLKASKRLGIDDPLIPQWKNVVKNLVDFPADENGFRLGSNQPSSPRHRHFSNLLMIYPLYLVNIEQEGTMEVLQKSYDRAHSINSLPAMVQSHAGPIGASLGQGDTVLEGLKRLQGNLYPNGMWFTAPCLESSLAMANVVQNMLIQSWSDPAKEESGPIRVFPAVPSAWKDVEFRDLRTEGAFLVSAKRTGGETKWVRIKSLAGEPCRVRPGFSGEVHIKSDRQLKPKQVSPGVYEIDMKKGDEVLLY